MNRGESSFGEPLSREPSPEDTAMRREEVGHSSVIRLSDDDQKKIETIWRNMKLFRRDLYRVFRAWVESLELRDEGSHYSHRVYRGWYAEQSRKLRMPENTVKSKLETAKKWFVARLRATAAE